MKWKKWLDNWDMTALKISAPFWKMEFSPQDEDKQAAWKCILNILTRDTLPTIACKPMAMSKRL